MCDWCILCVSEAVERLEDKLRQSEETVWKLKVSTRGLVVCGRCLWTWSKRMF